MAKRKNKTNNQMVELNSTTPIIALNVNKIYVSIKWKRI